MKTLLCFLRQIKAVPAANLLPLETRGVYFLHSAAECIHLRSPRLFVEAPAAPNYIRNHSGSEHLGFNNEIEAMHHFEHAAIDRRALRSRDFGSHRADELHPHTTNPAGREEAIMEDQIDHPAATSAQRRREMYTRSRCHDKNEPQRERRRYLTKPLNQFTSCLLFCLRPNSDFLFSKTQENTK